MPTSSSTTHGVGRRPQIAVDDPWQAIERLYEMGLTDGLPVVPPTDELVSAMLAGGSWAEDDVLLYEPSREISVTAHLAAVNAVMAGARPEYFPVIGATLQAMSDPRFRLHLPTTSTGGAAVLIAVNGPIRDQIGVHYRENLFGPGFRANATIGRTTRLVLRNCLSAIPGVLDKSTQGHPGKFALCFGEDETASPWEPFHVARGFDESTSTVTVFPCESGHNVVNHGAADPETLLRCFSDTMAAGGSFSNGYSIIVFAPEHANKIGAAGWSRTRVQEFLYENASRSVADLKRMGKIESAVVDTDWSDPNWRPSGHQTVAEGDDERMVHRGWGPDDISIFVGGGSAGGHSAFFPSWSRARIVAPITKEIVLP